MPSLLPTLIIFICKITLITVFNLSWVSSATAKLSLANIESINTINNKNIYWDSNVVAGQLDNGFSYVYFAKAKLGEPFNLRLIVNAGSVDDEMSGMAHIVEHMVFRSNRAHPIDIHRFLDSIGWKTGLQINALTRQTDTQYMLRTRPYDSLNLTSSIKLLSDLAFGAKMQESDWFIERNVILEEMRQGAGVAERINDQKKRIVRNGSRYIDRPTIGIKDDIKNITIADIRKFYNKFYVPSNMTLVASGHFDEQEFLSAIKQTFGKEKSKLAPARDYVKLPLHNDLVIGKVQDPKGTTSAVVYGFRSVIQPRATYTGEYERFQNYFIRKLLKEQIKQAQNVYKELHNQENASLKLTFSEPTNERLIIALASKTADHDAALPVVLREIERLKRFGIDHETFQNLKQKTKQILEKSLTTTINRSYTKWEDKIVAAIMQDGVEEDRILKNKRTLQWIDELTLEQLNARISKLLSVPDQFLFYQIPGGIVKELPSKTQVIAQIQQIKQEELAPLAKLILSSNASLQINKNKPLDQTKVLVKARELILPERPITPQAIEKIVDQDNKIIQWDLVNGDKVVWLNYQTDQDRLYIKAMSNAGYLNNIYPPWLTQAATQIWEQSDFNYYGVPYTNTQFKSLANKSKTKWHWLQSEQELSLSAVVTGQEQLQDLMASYLLINSFWLIDPNNFASLSKEMKEDLVSPSIKEQERNKFLGISSGMKPSKAELDSLTYQDFTSVIHRLSKQPTTFFIVGQTSEKIIKNSIIAYLSSIERTTNVVDNMYHVPAVLPEGKNTLIQKVYDEDKAHILIYGETSVDWSPENSFIISTLNSIIQKALKNKLRHELGLVYSIKFEIALNKNSQLNTVASFTTASQRAGELIIAYEEVLKDLPQIVMQENYSRIQSDIKFAEFVRLTDPNTWLRRLFLSYQKYDDATYLNSMLSLHQNITAQKMAILVASIFPLDKQAILINMPNDEVFSCKAFATK